ncbi:hypothetical protein [Xylanivirga thermophila]|jgi:hypothetical protein|uniref:hypothetical protein n=1 Tax=Xylanivirga thermophila TaxID=2496273 RepID=UPI00101C4124|nr:hypothetical protein [Xylanivirga thermophila]
MSIKPIDLQIVVNKSNEYIQEAYKVKLKPDIEQQQFAHQLQQQIKKEDTNVTSTHESIYNKIEHDQGRNTSFGDKKRDNNQDKEEENNKNKSLETVEKSLSGKGHNIDIRV